MHFEPHAALGWAIGNVGGADRQLRKWCVVGAILPDFDAIPYVFGAEVYARWHHTFGHNIFLWALFAGWVTYKCRSTRALVLSSLAFGSHVLTDAQFSGWGLQLFWPFSKARYLFPAAVGLEAPINTQLVYLSFALIALLAVSYKRTPLEIFSSRLDKLLLSFFQRKVLNCGFCFRKSNQMCVQCERSICVRHATVNKQLRLLCPDCACEGAARSVEL